MHPEEFGSYRLDVLLHRGGVGDVYRAFDTMRARFVALKILAPGLAEDPAYPVRFGSGMHAAARLTAPAVLIHRYGEIDGRLYLDMPLLSGRTVAAALMENGALHQRRAASIVSQVARALDAAHEVGLVHADLKPAKIVLTSDLDPALLVGLGVPRAALTGDWLARSEAAVAAQTLGYWAPEQFAEQVVSPRTDVYSLAGVLFACLTGRPPFPANSLAALMYGHLGVDPPAPSSLNPNVSRAMDEVVRRGMAKSPGDRFATAGELAEAARAASPPVLPPFPPPPGDGQLGPFGVPHATPVGWSSVSARGGGGGSVSFTATSARFDTVVELVSGHHGPPEVRTATTARWRSQDVERGWLRTSFVDVFVVGHGGGPGFDPSRVPPYARCVVGLGTLSTPDSGGEG